MKHTPTITTQGQARCSCRAWIAPAIQPNETMGHYTSRAYGDHARHVREMGQDTSAQCGLFPADVPAAPAPPLFR